jgi:S-adenosylmethionine:tRNA ribosyltransferase-isomerase
VSAAAFELPRALEACEPPEARGLARDGVRLLIARRREESIEHHVFSGLPDLLCPGDLLVVNVSATVPAAMGARRSDGTPLRVHFSSRAPRLEQAWRVVELRSADGARPIRAQIGELIRLDGGGELELVAPYAASVRLSLARTHGPSSVDAYLASHGEPIRYGYVTGRWALSAYQNVYATTPGSAEMPSAGRPFTAELITRLVARGILLAPITLHAAVSSPERHEPPLPEAFEVPVHTARLLRTVRAAGGRVIAVGTTVVRALETAAAQDGSVTSRTGWTDLVITPERGLRAVDGLITGWHEPEASHLQMLEAAAGPELLTRSYDAALEHGYLWHEFGDSHLILP